MPTTGDNHATQVAKRRYACRTCCSTKTGNTFDGWYKETEFTNKVTFPAIVINDFKLYAKWAAASSTSFTITITSNGIIALSGQRFLICVVGKSEARQKLLIDGATPQDRVDN